MMTDQQAYARLLAPKPDGLGLTKTKIAEMVGISKQAVGRWDAVPARYVKVLHEKTRVAKAKLLPSMFA